jgi:hypothetical protein
MAAEPGCRARCLALAAVLLLLASCSSARYGRAWGFEGADFTDTLTLAASTFRLDRISESGTSTFLGSYRVDGEEWRFEVEQWMAEDGVVRRFDPPVVYAYRGRSFLHGLAFFSYRVLTDARLELFIRAPGDFDELE